MAVTGLTVIDAADALTNWTNEAGSVDGIATNVPVQGSGCIFHTPSSSARFYERLDFSAVDLSGQGRFYFWHAMTSPVYVARLSNKDAANPGISIRLEDSGGNWSEWDITGQDAYEATHPKRDSTWRRYLLDPLDGSPDTTSGTLDTSDVVRAEWRITRDVGAATQHIIDYVTYGEGLRIDGGTVGTPNDFDDLLSHDVTNAQGVLLQSRSSEIQELGNLAFGTPSGSTDTHFVDETGRTFSFSGLRGSTDVEFAIYDETNTRPKWEIIRGGTGETHFRIGTLAVVGGEDVVSNGGQIVTDVQGRYDIECVAANVDELLIYGWVFKDGNDFTMGDGTTQIDNVEVTGCTIDGFNEVILDLGSSSKFRSIVANGNATDALSIHGVATGVIQNTISRSNTRGITFHESGTFDATNLTLLNNTTDIHFGHPSGTVTLSLINSTSDPTTSQVDNARAWDITEETLYNANVESGGSPLQNARVRLTNTAGTEEFSVLTDASGDITEQNVVRRTQEHSAGLPKASPTETVHTPFTKQVRFADQIPQSIGGFMPAEETVNDSFILLDEPFFTDLVATVAAFTGIAINEATTPDRIEVTEDHTINEVFEWLRWYTASASGDHLSDPMQTADGVTYTVADYDFLVSGSGVVLSGAGKTLSMATKDFTTAAGGSTTCKVTDIDGTSVITAINTKTSAGANIENARVLLEASDGTGDLPFEGSVTITRSGTTATVSHTTHGMLDGDNVNLDGITDKTEDNHGTHAITVTGASSYTYTTTDSGSTSYTGTITATGVLLDALTDASGNVSRARVLTGDQPVTGRARKSTGSPLYRTFDLADTVDGLNGLTINVRMILDE